MNNRLAKEFIIYLEKVKGYSNSTIRAYRNDLLHFLSYLQRGGIDPLKVTHKMLRRYTAFLTTLNLSRKTIARKISTLKSFYRWLYKRKLIDVSPATSLSVPKIPKTIPRFWNEPVVEVLLKSIKPDDLLSIRDLALFDLIYSCGLRISEVKNLDLKDVDMKERMVRIFGKGSKERYVPIPEKTINNINLYLTVSRPSLLKDKRNQKAFFVNRYGERLSDAAIRKRFHKYLKLPDISASGTVHTLRHSLATHLLDRGVDLRIVQEVLGHSSLAATQVYTHLNKKTILKKYRGAHPRS